MVHETRQVARTHAAHAKIAYFWHKRMLYVRYVFHTPVLRAPDGFIRSCFRTVSLGFILLTTRRGTVLRVCAYLCYKVHIPPDSKTSGVCRYPFLIVPRSLLTGTYLALRWSNTLPRVSPLFSVLPY